MSAKLVERYDETYETVVEYFTTHSLVTNDPYRAQSASHDEYRLPLAPVST